MLIFCKIKIYFLWVALSLLQLRLDERIENNTTFERFSRCTAGSNIWLLLVKLELLLVNLELLLVNLELLLVNLELLPVKLELLLKLWLLVVELQELHR
jgi:hypothetical protein